MEGVLHYCRFVDLAELSCCWAVSCVEGTDLEPLGCMRASVDSENYTGAINKNIKAIIFLNHF